MCLPKKWVTRSRTRPRCTDNFGLPLSYGVNSTLQAAKFLKYIIHKSLRHRFFYFNRCLRPFSFPSRWRLKVPGPYTTDANVFPKVPGDLTTGASGPLRHRFVFSPGTKGLGVYIGVPCSLLLQSLDRPPPQ